MTRKAREATLMRPEEAGQRRPVWSQLDHLIAGARERGFSEAQCEYLTSCIGIAWAKAAFETERALRVK